jgi:hypothetical protein
LSLLAAESRPQLVEFKWHCRSGHPGMCLAKSVAAMTAFVAKRKVELQ